MGAANQAFNKITGHIFMSKLFSSISLGPLSLQNRIAVAPMCQYSAKEGEATSWHVIHLGHLALSSAGILFIEATAVEPEGRISPQDLGLWSDATGHALAQALRAVRENASIPIAIQLSHAGRKASVRPPWEGGRSIRSNAGGWATVAPSPIPFASDDEIPEALDKAGLQRIREGFAASAKRADRIGIDAIELHGAHGYLLHQFLSPLSNRRDDEYGGSLENRLRFPLEVFDAVRAAFPPDKAVGMRVSATDWVEGGWDIEQTTAFAHELKKRGCHFLHVSSGGLSPLQKIPVGPGYQVPFAAHLKRETGLPTIAVGLITEAEQAETIIATGQADMVALARGMLYDPRWPWHAAAKLGAQVDAPRQYWRSQPRAYKDLFRGAKLG
jgi:2,4-dienoyl-CoA reductase-like NADH-dependent reductase (Old Yellow Enzyme family)